MNYFVNIKKCNSHLWQTELLIESFKHHKLEDNLYIAIAESDNQINSNFCGNLLEHKNKYVYNDLGGPAQNRFYSLAVMIMEGTIKTPLTTIHSDMVLVNPVKKYEHNITLSHTSEDHRYKAFITGTTSLVFKPGNVYVANDLENSFFTRMYEISAELENKHPNQSWLEKGIWYLAYLENKSLTVKHDVLEQTMKEYDLYTNFIHYKHGLPPSFNKHKFKYESIEIAIDDPDPFSAICSLELTRPAVYMAGLAKKCGHS